MARTSRAAQHQQFKDFAFDVLLKASPLAISTLSGTNPDVARIFAEMSKNDRPFVRLSPKAVQLKYGMACASLYRIMFVLMQRGGYSDVTHEGYASIWMYDLDVERNAAFSEILNSNVKELTASDVVNFMTSKGFLPIERVKIVEDGKVVSHFASGDALSNLKMLKSFQNEQKKTRKKNQIEYAKAQLLKA